MSQETAPECDECGDRIEDETDFVNVSGGTVHRSEPQTDAGGGMFHPSCAVTYIERTYGQ